MRRWRGLKKLIHDAVDTTVELVREGHESTSRGVRSVTDEISPLREPVRKIDGVRRVLTAGVLESVKGVNRVVEAVTDAGLDYAVRGEPAEEVPVALRSDVAGSRNWLGDSALALLNAAVGDYLSQSGNQLDISMVFRIGDRYVPLTEEALAEAMPEGRPRVAFFVHGLGATEWSWFLAAEEYHGDSGASFATLLERDLGITPIFVRYNAGRHVSQNGRMLAEMLEVFVARYPGELAELNLFGHSMGGLVVRSACHHAEEAEHGWTRSVRRIFYLASPHRGAPLAKFGHLVGTSLAGIDLPTTRIISRIVEGRSDGIKDLRHGALIDEEWFEPHPLASRDSIPAQHARHYFFGATVARDPEHPVSRIVGDLLVRVPSASGEAIASEQFEISTRTYGGILHHQLQNHPDVYAQIVDAFSEEPLSDELT